MSVIKEWIEAGTTINSDCWKSYGCLNEVGFSHFTVSHSVTFVNPDTGWQTNSIESMGRHVKAILKIFIWQLLKKKKSPRGYNTVLVPFKA